MKIYLSAPSCDLKVAKEAMDLCRKEGHEITYDWTVSFDEFVNEERLADFGFRDIDGVDKADCLIAIVKGEPSLGVAVEIGAAFVSGAPVILVEPSKPNPRWLCCPFRAMIEIVSRSSERLSIFSGRRWCDE